MEKKIRKLLEEAILAGDARMVRLCEVALDTRNSDSSACGRLEAWAECVRVIQETETRDAASRDMPR